VLLLAPFLVELAQFQVQQSVLSWDVLLVVLEVALELQLQLKGLLMLLGIV
jgi:hypothetical protein